MLIQVILIVKRYSFYPQQIYEEIKQTSSSLLLSLILC